LAGRSVGRGGGHRRRGAITVIRRRGAITVIHRDGGGHGYTSKEGSNANKGSDDHDHYVKEIKGSRTKKPSKVSVLDEKKSANIPPRECEACTLSKRVISRKVEEGSTVENQLD
jgi:hypothetical protein